MPGRGHPASAAMLTAAASVSTAFVVCLTAILLRSAL